MAPGEPRGHRGPYTGLYAKSDDTAFVALTGRGFRAKLVRLP